MGRKIPHILIRAVKMGDQDESSNQATPFKDAKDPTSALDTWLIRPCDYYHEEYQDCKSYKGRFNEKFIYGEVQTKRCDQWLTDYKNCLKYKKTQSIVAADELISSEKERRRIRLFNANNNDVWEYRTEPPEDWNSPLPEKLRENSLPDNVTLDELQEQNTQRCAIM